ncbi:MAG: tRNA (cytidine(34)-2'-O)-methyltransferase [Alphaproteobacteria bacterium]|nr:tRNA (cytidine(34)-2'-O)-methyltransferase [Alphaproteobacteria bacterium]
MHIALLTPEIPGNTGNIGRLAVGIGARLHLIHPLGFSTSEKAVRRAGIDHWRLVDVVEHDSLAAFLGWAGGRPLHLFSSHGRRPHTACPFARGDVLLFGPESVGLPTALVDAHGAWRVPMPGPVRSLNLSNAVAVVSYAALQRISPSLFAETP